MTNFCYCLLFLILFNFDSSFWPVENDRNHDNSLGHRIELILNWKYQNWDCNWLTIDFYYEMLASWRTLVLSCFLLLISGKFWGLLVFWQWFFEYDSLPGCDKCCVVRVFTCHFCFHCLAFFVLSELFWTWQRSSVECISCHRDWVVMWDFPLLSHLIESWKDPLELFCIRHLTHLRPTMNK